MKRHPIGDLCSPVLNWNPALDAPNDIINYIDISSIDRESKRVTLVNRLSGEEAPSRAKQLVKANDILVSTVRPNLNAVTVVPAELDGATASTGFTVLRADPTKLAYRYLFHWVKTPQFVMAMVKLATGASYPAVTDAIVKASKIPLPSLPEQRRIAAILDKADAMRELRRQSISKLDTLLKAVFLEMFGDPVRNPKGLPTKPIKDFGVVTTGNTPSRSNPEYYGPEIEWIKSDNINTPFHTLTVAEERLSEIGCRVGRVVPAGSVLITCIAGSRDCIGNAAMANRMVAFNQQINAITPNNGTNPYFLYTQILLSKRLIQRASTNSMKGMVSKSEFSEIELLAPPQEKQDQFGGWFERFHDLSRKHHKALSLQEELFRALQQRAFTGKLFTEKAAAAAQQELFAD